MPDVMPILIHHDALHIPNLGIASVGANVDERHSVYIADLFRKRRSVKRFILRVLRRFQPQVVGLSAMTWQFETCKKIIRLIKTTFPDTMIVLGGYHATLMWKIASPLVRLGILFNTYRYGWRGRYERFIAKKKAINHFKDLEGAG